jgi:hypothetical protein
MATLPKESFPTASECMSVSIEVVTARVRVTAGVDAGDILALHLARTIRK